MTSKLLVILNPKSGSHEVKTSSELIEGRMTQEALPYELRVTTKQDDAFQWGLQAVQDGFSKILVGGGDGTITEVMNGVLSSDKNLPIGVLPLGTANGLARFLEIPIDINEALEIAITGETTQIDVGYVLTKDSYFVIFAGAGWDAETIALATRQAKERFGGLAYIGAALKSLRKHSDQLITLTLDGKSRTLRGHSVLIFNANDFQLGNVSLGPKSDPRDGLFDIYVLKEAHLTGVLKLIGKFMMGRENNSNLSHFRAKRVKVEAHASLKTQIDGDVLDTTPLEVEVRPQALTLMAPQGFAKHQEKVFSTAQQAVEVTL
jgi:diacylglycerol kinase (ATP)